MDWLDIAAGVESGKVTTAKHDDTLMYCGNAIAYENKRSELLSILATRLTIFNFVWGSFETVAKELLDIKRRGVVDKTIKFLKGNYYHRRPIANNEDTLYSLLKFIEDNESYEFDYEMCKLHDIADLNGLGLDLVRQIRNDLAHGSAHFPTPDNWERGKTDLLSSERRHLNLIDTCTRIILLTVQMLLIAHVHGNEIMVKCFVDEDGDKIKSTAEQALHFFHLEADSTNENQLSFFNQDAFI